jgi:hypothetical protein
MQDELRGTNTDLNIEIVGVNQTASAAYNYLIINRTLPWLQDTAVENVESRWQAEYRDVRILDWQNEVQAVYNLTEHDLSVATNRAALKALFLATAKAADSDGDGLPDSWEIHHFGNLATGPDDDADLDGINNRTEFAFGTDPTDPKSLAPMKATFSRQGTPGPVVYSYRRPAGSIMSYIMETSLGVEGPWGPNPQLVTVQPRRNLYDGTGTSEVICWPTAAGLKQPFQFFRVKAVKP